MTERELTARVSLTRPDGTFNPASHGWCRQPLVDCAAIGRRDAHHGRNKRWEYWCILSPTHIIGLTIASLDTFAAHDVWVLDRASGREITRAAAALGKDGDAGCVIPANVEGDARASGNGLAIEIIQEHGGTRLRGAIPGVEFDVLAQLPPGHERLGVVVPWSDTLFQYTVKDVCRPALGTIVITDGGVSTITTLSPGESWAVLDHGRGRWPAQIGWNWAAGCGMDRRGRVLGLQLGGRWTDGTGSTENAVLVRTKLHKISVALEWSYDKNNYMAPWRVRGGGLDATLTPFFDKVSRVDSPLTASRTDQCFGTWKGTFDTGSEVVEFDGLLGFAEDVWRRW